jgi:general nucleoside transport system ATP-binding protein
MTAPRLELIGISKQYPAVKANDNVSLSVEPGEIHALLGENGAGKSTLMKIVFGAVQPDEGEIRVDGQTVQIRNPHEARALGIAMVFQHFSLFDTLTAAENVWLGLDTGESLADVTERIREKAATYGLDVDRRAPAGRDRARPAVGSQAADPRRADLGADAAGGAAPVHDAAPVVA